MDKLQKLKSEREKFRTKVFSMMLQVAIIFGLPAVIAFFAGKKVDKYFSTENVYLFIFLGIAFFISWSIMIYIYLKLNKKAKELDLSIKQAKDEQLRNMRKIRDSKLKKEESINK